MHVFYIHDCVCSQKTWLRILRPMYCCEYFRFRFVSLYYSLFTKWTGGEERPANGALVQLITKDGKTDLMLAN